MDNANAEFPAGRRRGAGDQLSWPISMPTRTCRRRSAVVRTGISAPLLRGCEQGECDDELARQGSRARSTGQLGHRRVRELQAVAGVRAATPFQQRAGRTSHASFRENWSLRCPPVSHGELRFRQRFAGSPRYVAVNTSVVGRGNHQTETKMVRAEESDAVPRPESFLVVGRGRGPIHRWERAPPPHHRSAPHRSEAAGGSGGAWDVGLVSAHRRSCPATAAGQDHPSAHRRSRTRASQPQITRFTSALRDDSWSQPRQQFAGVHTNGGSTSVNRSPL